MQRGAWSSGSGCGSGWIALAATWTPAVGMRSKGGTGVVRSFRTRTSGETFVLPLRAIRTGWSPMPAASKARASWRCAAFPAVGNSKQQSNAAATRTAIQKGDRMVREGIVAFLDPRLLSVKKEYDRICARRGVAQFWTTRSEAQKTLQSDPSRPNPVRHCASVVRAFGSSNFLTEGRTAVPEHRRPAPRAAFSRDCADQVLLAQLTIHCVPNLSTNEPK